MSIQGLGSSASAASWLGGQGSREQARRSAEPCSLDAMGAALIALYRRLIESGPP